MMRKSEQRLERAYRTLVLLQTRRYGLTVDEIADEIGVCRRTVYRHVIAMQAAGIPLVKLRERWRFFDSREIEGT